MLMCVECGSTNGKGSLLGYYICECDGGAAAAGEFATTQCPMCGEITGDMEAAECVEVICRECMIRYY